MKDKNSIGYNFVMNTIIQGSAYILPLIANPYVSRVLGPEGMGQISYVTAILYYFTMFAVLGAPTYGIREVARTKEDKQLLSGTVYGIFVINLIMGLIVYVIYFAYVSFAPLSPGYRKLLIVMSPMILLNLIGLEWLYKGLERFSVIAVRNVIVKLIVLALIFLCVHRRENIYFYGFLTVMASYGVGLWNFLGHFSYVSIRHIKGFVIRKHILPLLLFFSMTIATTIYTNLDMVMLGAMRGDYEAGIYDASTKLKIVAIAAVSSLGAVLLPRVTALVAQGKMEEFRRVSAKALNLIILFSLSLTICVGINTKTLILLFSGERFWEAASVLMILCPTFLLIGMTNIIGIQMLLPLGKEKQVLASEIIGAVINLILNMLLIPQYSAAGAAIGTLVAEFSVFAVQLYACREFIITIFAGVQFYKIAVAGSVAGLLAWIGGRLFHSPWGSLLCSASVFYLTYGGILIALREKECLWIIGQIKNRRK